MELNADCYHDVAELTLENHRVIKLLNSVSKGICNKVPDTVISAACREQIQLPLTTKAEAAGYIKQVSNYNNNNLVPNLRVSLVKT